MDLNLLSRSIPMISRSYGRSTINVGCLMVFLPIFFYQSYTYVNQDVPLTCRLSPPTLTRDPSNVVNLGLFFEDSKTCWK
ncbi:hypothetical protein XELAEV_18011417mg [Xenopus laevis]|uniref:Uncharacterized protein n=1 Tax=Xenopus laevis TaxID=8355 RepID=A0A974DMN2_XENLA|nr:hypothetical protein XELAEV_18011417mg [Xenopus laevis]